MPKSPKNPAHPAPSTRAIEPLVVDAEPATPAPAGSLLQRLVSGVARPRDGVPGTGSAAPGRGDHRRPAPPGQPQGHGFGRGTGESRRRRSPASRFRG